jgi:hypothetical protein
MGFTIKIMKWKALSTVPMVQLNTAVLFIKAMTKFHKDVYKFSLGHN